MLLLYTSPTIKATSSKASFSKTIISVYDKITNKPINNAKIVIAETSECYYTSSRGTTPTITLPYTKNERFKQSTANKPWTEFTLIIFKSGYLPHIHYNFKTEENRTKLGTIINLTPIINETEQVFTTSYEEPSDNYSLSLIQKYKNLDT